MIREALSELIMEHGYNNISITDLTAKADINRGTFYLHYTDKHDLLEQVENEVINEISDRARNVNYEDMQNMDSAANIDFINKPMPFMIIVFEYIKENSKFMKAILCPKGDPRFYDKLKNLLETNLFGKNLINAVRKENMMIPEEYFLSYILSAHLGVIQKWLDNDMKESPEEMALILSKMFFLGPYKITGLNQAADMYGWSKD
jgi:AcrR family transcriptional regulator